MPRRTGDGEEIALADGEAAPSEAVGYEVIPLRPNSRTRAGESRSRSRAFGAPSGRRHPRLSAGPTNPVALRG